LGAGAGRGAGRRSGRGRRHAAGGAGRFGSRARVPDPAPLALLRLQGPVPVEEEVRSALRASLPGLSRTARPSGGRAGPRACPEPGRPAVLLPSPCRGFLLMVAVLALCAALAHGTVQRLTMSAPSLGEPRRDVRVYLPPSYFDPDARSRRYPTVYLLH